MDILKEAQNSLVGSVVDRTRDVVLTLGPCMNLRRFLNPLKMSKNVFFQYRPIAVITVSNCPDGQSH